MTILCEGCGKRMGVSICVVCNTAISDKAIGPPEVRMGRFCGRLMHHSCLAAILERHMDEMVGK